ncbi:histamine N-methyltransferase-like [Ptychodera flava]|uniref:histamine N-methyltransferase-like n=1 Tax=Ptychodera flava TaxID=63121 RepID=UPI00396A43A4
MEEVKILKHHPKEYYNRLCTYKKYCFHYLHERQVDFKDIFDKLQVKKDSLQVLAIGTGNGDADVPVIDLMTNKQFHINYIVVEPDAAEIEKFKSLVASKQEQGDWKSVNFEFNQTTIENYLKEAKKAQVKVNFDIIHTIHSAYQFTDHGSIFADLYDILGNRGILVNTMVAGPQEQVNAKAMEINPGTRECPGSASLRRMIQRRLPDIEIHTRYRKSYCSVDECFKEDSKDGNMLLDFLVQVVDFRKHVKEGVLSDFMAFFRAHCYVKDGQLILDSDEEDIVIFKK